MSGCFYAIGGANYAYKESLEIDLDILKETKKSAPNVLYIGAALDDDLKQINTFKKYYESLGFNVDILYTYERNISHSEIEKQFLDNDVLYFGGGITLKLISFIKRYNLEKLIYEMYLKNKIIAGVSAGAIMMFSYGFGDKDAFTYNLTSVNHKMTPGIGIFKGTFCPHYQNSGGIFYHDDVKNYPLNGFAVENGAALKIKDNSFEIIKNNNSNVFMFDMTNNYKLIHLKSGILYDINLLK